MVEEKKESLPSEVESKHPTVRLLLRKVSHLLMHLSPDEAHRFRLMTRALAVPITILLKHTGQGEVRGRIQREFVLSMERLSHLDVAHDEHFTLIKAEVARYMQLAVGDVDSETGHVLLPLPGVERLFGPMTRKLILRWVARARQGNGVAMNFFASLLLNKRGWPVLCDLSRWETIQGHQKYLSSEPTELPPDVPWVISTVVKTVCSNLSLGGVIGSPNASYESSRKKGGAAGELQRILDVEEIETILGRLEQGKRELACDVANRTGEAVEVEPLSLHDLNQAILLYDKNVWEQLVKHYRAKLEREFIGAPSCRVQVIDEAGKFRPITAGPADLYTLAQPLQKSLLNNWKKTSFSTMNLGWEEEVRGWTAPPGWVWNSGDYKAATDQLNANATRVAITTIQNLYDVHLDFFLVGSWIEYDKRDISYGENVLPRVIKQRNGQLMGHPLSFPILCMINLAGLVVALKRGIELKIINEEQRDFILCHTKINGDDILFPCPKKFCGVWEQAASDVGLKLSVGKSYASEDFAMINNVMFLMKQHRRIGFANQTLIWNYNVKEGRGAIAPMEIGHAFGQMFEFCPDAADFLPDCVANRKDLKLMGYQPHFFIPSALGGFGVPLKWNKSETLRASPLQRRVAKACLENKLNGFLLANGIAQDFVEKFIPELPKTRSFFELDVRVELPRGILPILVQDQMLGTVRTLLDREELGLRRLTFDDESFKGLVGGLSRLIPAKEQHARRVKVESLQSVRPATLHECFHGLYGFVPPQGMPQFKAFHGNYRNFW